MIMCPLQRGVMIRCPVHRRCCHDQVSSTQGAVMIRGPLGSGLS